MKELRRENAVWKNAHKKSEDDHEVTKRVVSRLERNMDAIKVRAPRVHLRHRLPIWL